MQQDNAMRKNNGKKVTQTLCFIRGLTLKQIKRIETFMNGTFMTCLPVSHFQNNIPKSNRKSSSSPLQLVAAAVDVFFEALGYVL